jgi:hypothetical protein
VLVAAFQDDCAGFGLLYLPPSPGAIFIDDHDGHVIAAAIERGYKVLTADNGLRAELVRRGLPEIAPDDFMFLSNGSTFPTFNEGNCSDRVAFQILFWATPTQGSAHKMKMKRALLSAEGWGCLLYDNWTRQFCFESASGASISTPFELKEEVTAFAISSEVEAGNLAKAKSAIYIGNPNAKNSHYIPHRRLAQPNGGGAIYLGSRQGTCDSWNGYIRSLSIKSVWLSKEMWNFVRITPDFRPTYADANRLQGAIRRSAELMAI